MTLHFKRTILDLDCKVRLGPITAKHEPLSFSREISTHVLLHFGEHDHAIGVSDLRVMGLFLISETADCETAAKARARTLVAHSPRMVSTSISSCFGVAVPMCSHGKAA